ncbi:hypothetical protein BGZ72_009146, partial [Mortierella alpina]
MADSITSSLNDSSLVFYRVNEHIHKKVPLLVQEKKALVEIRKSVETANQDMEDARQTISSMQRISELSHIEDLLMERTDQPQPCEPSGSNPTSRDKQAADDDVASKEAKRNAYLLQLRNELLADMSDSDEDLHIQPTTPTTSFKNPFKQKEAEPQPKVPEPQPAAKAKSLEGALATRHDTQQTADLDDEGPDGLLSEAELVLLGRVRRLVEASTPKPKKNTIVRPGIVPPEKPPSIFPSRGTPTRHDGEDRSSTAKPPMPYDKGLRRRRRQNCTHEHDGEECDDSPRSDAGSGQAHDQEAPTEEQQEVQRTSHNGLQIRSQVVPKRHVRSLPGRYSALDSDEEEEWFRQYDKEQ